MEYVLTKDNAKALTDRLMIRIQQLPIIGGCIEEIFGDGVEIKLGKLTTSTSAYDFVISLGSVSRLFRKDGIVLRLKVILYNHEYYDNDLGMFIKVQPDTHIYKVYVDIEHEDLIKKFGNNNYRLFSFSLESLIIDADITTTESSLEDLMVRGLSENAFEHEEIYETHRTEMLELISSLSMYTACLP